MKYKLTVYRLIIAMMSITAAIALTCAQFVISTKISNKILWQVQVVLKLVTPGSPVHYLGNAVTMIEWNPEVQLATLFGGLIFGVDRTPLSLVVIRECPTEDCSPKSFFDKLYQKSVVFQW